jgi:hypothetical protein
MAVGFDSMYTKTILHKDIVLFLGHNIPEGQSSR